MSGEIIAAIVVGSALLYSTLAGVAWQMAGANWDSMAPFFAAVLWPLVLPAMLGVALTRRIAAKLSRPAIPMAKVRP